MNECDIADCARATEKQSATRRLPPKRDNARLASDVNQPGPTSAVTVKADDSYSGASDVNSFQLKLNGMARQEDRFGRKQRML